LYNHKVIAPCTSGLWVLYQCFAIHCGYIHDIQRPTSMTTGILIEIIDRLLF